MTKLNYEFNREKAAEILPTLLDNYARKTDVFSQGKIFLPDEKPLPPNIERGSRLHALALFTYAPLTARTTSNNLYDSFISYLSRNPGFLDFEGIEGLTSILGKGKIGAGYLKRHPFSIVQRREVLERQYENDPRNIFVQHPDPREAIGALIKEMHGYACKTSSLFTLYGRKYFAKFENPERVLPAIDIHKIRILEMLGILKYESEGKKPTQVRDVLTTEFAVQLADFCIEREIDVMHLDEALWIIGAELCAKDNIAICHNQCPLDDLCAKEFTRDHLGHFFRPDKITGKNQMKLFRDGNK